MAEERTVSGVIEKWSEPKEGATGGKPWARISCVIAGEWYGFFARKQSKNPKEELQAFAEAFPEGSTVEFKQTMFNGNWNYKLKSMRMVKEGEAPPAAKPAVKIMDDFGPSRDQAIIRQTCIKAAARMTKKTDEALAIAEKFERWIYRVDQDPVNTGDNQENSEAVPEETVE